MIVKCPECGIEIDLLERCRHGLTLDDFKYQDGWLMPTHHEPGTPLLCDGTNQKVEIVLR